MCARAIFIVLAARFLLRRNSLLAVKVAIVVRGNAFAEERLVHINGVLARFWSMFNQLNRFGKEQRNQISVSMRSIIVTGRSVRGTMFCTSRHLKPVAPVVRERRSDAMLDAEQGLYVEEVPISIQCRSSVS